MKPRKESAIAACLIALIASASTLQAHAEPQGPAALSEASIFRDPDLPALGDLQGDITIVEYFDYQCPFCKTFHPELSKIVRDDGHIRLVVKAWPVFGDVSVYAAKLALAAGYQNKFAEAHEALISVNEKLSEDSAQNALAQAGIDVERAKRDLVTNQRAINAVLERNEAQASALEFPGTPGFIVGHLRVPGALDPENFKQAIADARAAEKKNNK
jgi:protein-disulfide isomerase